MTRKKLRASFTLRPDVKKQWLAALRGGKYKQGYGALHTSDGAFCCLGVLCDLLDENKVGCAKKCFPESLPDFRERFGIPDSVSTTDTQWMWQVPYKGEKHLLLVLNDEVNLSFKQIANIIERTVDVHES